MRYSISILLVATITVFTCCCTDKPDEPKPAPVGKAGTEPAKAEKPPEPPPAPAKKWAFRDADGNYKTEFTDAEHPMKKQSGGHVSVLRTYTAVPAPAKGKKLVAVFDTTQGKIGVNLYYKDAPQHVANIVSLAQDGFYEKSYLHRIVKGFMIQGGDPNTKNDNPADDGRGGAGFYILDEFSKTRRHAPGILSAASLGAPNTSGCQFFMMHGQAPFLDGRYSIYGEVIEGMDIVNKIAATPCTDRPGPRGPENSVPTVKTYINEVKIEER